MKATTKELYLQIESMIKTFIESNQKISENTPMEIVSKVKDIFLKNSNVENKSEFETKFISAFKKVSKTNRNLWIELIENFKSEEKQNVYL